MNYPDMLSARLAGDGADLERRRQFLTTFVAAYERGGADEAAGALTRQLATLEETFAQNLADLHQLL